MVDLKIEVKNREFVVSKPIKVYHEMTLNENNPSDLTGYFFNEPYGQDDGVIRSLLCDVNNFFQQSGVSPENLQAAVLTFTALNSVRLGFPFSVILKTDELSKTRHLVNVCKQLAPRESFREVQELKYEQLYNDKKYFEDRVIICQDTSGVKKAMPDLLMLLTQGYATRQENYKSKLGVGIQEHTIQYPIGFIGIEPIDGKSFLDHPSIIKIPMANANCFNGQMMPIVFHDRFQKEHQGKFIEARRIAKTFERLRYRVVNIQCINQAFFHIIKQQPISLREKIDVISKVFSIITIMNHPRKVTPDEVYGSFIEAKIENINMAPKILDALTATKAEYFITKTLLNDVITVRNESVTADEIKIFEAIKKINFGKLQSALIDQNNIRGKLWLLIDNDIYWAKKEEIYKQVNNTTIDILSLPAVEKGLQSLNKMNFIATKRIEKSRQYGYYIVVPKANGSINFPHPSQIIDPIFKDQSVEVVNPLTGDIETI